MSGTALRVFRSTGVKGYTQHISADPGTLTARKLEREVQVRFAATDCIVTTREGAVHARAGDAIITGVAGETWRVSRVRFGDKYRPASHTAAGEPGFYMSRPYEIRALRMVDAFDVVLADGVSRLHGQPDDWLVDYGDGSLGVVAPSIFATTYEILS